MNYAMVTVKLDHLVISAEQAYQEIKKVLKISEPDIQEQFGAVPMEHESGEYVVLIERARAEALQNENHPNVVNVFSNPHLGPTGSRKKGPSGPKI